MCHLDDSLRGSPFVARYEGPIVDVGSGGGAPGIPLAAALPDREVVLLEATRRKCDFLESLDGFPNVRVVCGRAEEQQPDSSASRSRRRWRRRRSRSSGACALVRPGGAAILLVGPSADVGRVAQVAGRLGGGRARGASRARSWSRRSRRRRQGFPRRAGSREETPARLGRDSSAREERMFGWLGGSTQSRTRRAGSARRRPPSTSPPVWPRRASGRSSSTSTRRRTRPRGSASGRTGRRATTCSTARRSRSSSSRRASRTSGSSRRSRTSPARRSSSRARTTARPSLPSRSVARRDGYSFVFLDCPRRSGR